MAELADAGDLKSLDFGLAGSSPAAPTTLLTKNISFYLQFCNKKFMLIGEVVWYLVPFGFEI